MSAQEKKLSTEEMAALRSVAVEDETVTASSEEQTAKVQVVSYNFRQPGRLSSVQLRALKVVHEFFAKRLSEERFGGLDLPCELGLLSVETISYSNFMGSMGNPCFLAQLSSGFEQAALMEIDLPLIRALVARILGDEDADDPESKPLTSIEQTIAGNCLESFFPILRESWSMSASTDFGLKSIDCDPRFVQAMPDDSPVVSLAFHFQIGATKGHLTLCYPLEPLQELLEGMSRKMSGGDEEDPDQEEGRTRILTSLKSVPFELRAELGRSSIRANQLASLRKGDVLCLNRSIHDLVDVFLGSNHVFSAQLGKKGDSLALQLSSRHEVN